MTISNINLPHRKKYFNWLMSVGRVNGGTNVQIFKDFGKVHHERQLMYF